MNFRDIVEVLIGGTLIALVVNVIFFPEEILIISFPLAIVLTWIIVILIWMSAWAKQIHKRG